MITVQSGRLEPPEGTGPRTATETYFFDHQIRACWVTLAGFGLGYGDDDHHVKTMSVDLTATIEDTEFGRGVVVGAALVLRDKNGDDAFSGWVDYVLFVDLGQRLGVVDGGGAVHEPVISG